MQKEKRINNVFIDKKIDFFKKNNDKITSLQICSFFQFILREESNTFIGTAT